MVIFTFKLARKSLWNIKVHKRECTLCVDISVEGQLGIDYKNFCHIYKYVYVRVTLEGQNFLGTDHWHFRKCQDIFSL